MTKYTVPYDTGFAWGEYITNSLKDALSKSKETSAYGEVYMSIKIKVIEYSELRPEYKHLEKDLTWVN